jgi:SOS-response transcriptional repressor LexA
MLFNVYLDDLDFFIENLINKSSYDQESYYIFQKLNLINQKSQKKVISMLKVTSFLNNKKFNKSNIKPMINYIRYINT